LTFDGLTVAWLNLKLRLWWWRARGLPRRWALLILATASGCVPMTRYEEAKSAAALAQEGQHRAEQQVAELSAQTEELRGQLQAQNRKLEAEGESLNQAQFDTSTELKQRQEAEGLVEQLRGELARASSHLRAYQDDKQKLEAALDADGIQKRELIALTRDVALSFADPLATGEYALETEQGALVLRVTRSDLFGAGDELSAESARVLEPVVRLLARHPQAKLRLVDRGAPTEGSDGGSKVSSALGKLGLQAERFEQPNNSPSGSEPEASPAAPEIRFYFSVQ
jgi:hypothetical protein